jgi:hypothetical protein
MSEDGSLSTEVATAFAKELADKFPVEEALTPAATQTGLILSDFVKTLHLALVPFQLLGAYQDRLRNFIDNSVRRVPEEKRIRPAPQILGPVIEGIRYEPEGTPIEAMFSELLSRSIDKDRVEEAHPAYPLIIRQLSADEAKILGRLKGRGFDYVYTKALNDQTKLFSGEPAIEVDAFPRDGLSFPNNISFYFDHLNQLGLAGIYQIGNQEALFNGALQTGTRIRSQYTLTSFGRRFLQACTGTSVPL